MNNTKGLTLIGMLLVMSTVVIFGILAMRIIPVYLEHYAVLRALDNLPVVTKDELSSDLGHNNLVIKRALQKQFEIESMYYITEDNITLNPVNESKMKISIHYQVIRPFIANISLLFIFNDTKEVSFGTD